MGQRILAINRNWLLCLLKSQPLEDRQRPIPADAAITDVNYLPLSQDILLTIASEEFSEAHGQLMAHNLYRNRKEG